VSAQESQSGTPIDPIAHLDFKPSAPTCGVQLTRFGGLKLEPKDQQVCGRPAQWLMSCRNCAQSAYCCNAHKLVFQRDTVSRRGRCGVTGPWSMVFRFTAVVGA